MDYDLIVIAIGAGVAPVAARVSADPRISLLGRAPRRHCRP
jgi:hypothetical protein